jgi:outer membrane protein TolC
LLNAHLQLVQAENTWARAQANHMIAQAKLKFATATLLSYREP